MSNIFAVWRNRHTNGSARVRKRDQLSRLRRRRLSTLAGTINPGRYTRQIGNNEKCCKDRSNSREDGGDSVFLDFTQEKIGGRHYPGLYPKQCRLPDWFNRRRQTALFRIKIGRAHV